MLSIDKEAPSFHSGGVSTPKKNPWQSGCDDFNAQRYWYAHEGWEQEWKALPTKQRNWVQGCIQAAAVFVLLEQGRFDPAQRLARRAFELLREGERSQIDIPGVSILMRAISDVPADNVSKAQVSDWLSQAKKLKASLWVDPPEGVAPS